MRVVVPSAGRAEALSQRTLAYLERQGLAGVTDVWVPRSEVSEYEHELGERVHLVAHDERPGLARVRNLIAKAYPVGTRILSLDDDVESVVRLRQPCHHVVYEANLGREAEWLFDIADQNRVSLWGVTADAHPRKLRPDARLTPQRLVPGPCFGWTSRKDDPRLLASTTAGEDYERTAQFLERDGRVLFATYLGVRVLAFRVRYSAKEKSGLGGASLLPELHHKYITSSMRGEEIRLKIKRQAGAVIERVAPPPDENTPSCPDCDAGRAPLSPRGEAITARSQTRAT